jgi:hypothetical protein
VEGRTDSADGTWVHRHDRGDLLASHVRADGTLLVEGFAAREGVLEYRQTDGSIRREFVSTKTLLDSAAGLARATVTLEHPKQDVSPDNVKELGVGDVDGEVTVQDGGFVRVRMAVRRRDAIEAIRGGKQELSPGYRVRIQETPGEHPVHGRYDAVQAERQYNHLAIVDRARGGADVRLRADGLPVAIATSSIRADAAPSVTPTQRGTMKPGLVRLIALLGITQRADSDDAAIDAITDTVTKRKDAEDRLTADRDTQKSRADAAEAKVATVTADRDREKARADAAEAELARVKAEAKTRADADERKGLEELAGALRVDAAKHPKNGELKRALAVAHLGADLRADASDAYVDALLDLARKDHADGREAGARAWDQPAARDDGAPPAVRKSRMADRWGGQPVARGGE